MCNLPIPVCSLSYRRHFQRRGPPWRRIPSNLSYSSLASRDNFTVAGGLWNCQSATQKADFITAYASLLSLQFLLLNHTESHLRTLLLPSHSPFSFSHTSRPSSHGGGTGLLISPSWTFSIFPLTNLSPSTLY